jgi:hypothetical protein
MNRSSTAALTPRSSQDGARNDLAAPGSAEPPPRLPLVVRVMFCGRRAGGATFGVSASEASRQYPLLSRARLVSLRRAFADGVVPPISVFEVGVSYTSRASARPARQAPAAGAGHPGNVPRRAVLDRRAMTSVAPFSTMSPRLRV